MKKNDRPIQPTEARQRLEALCAKAEHCRWELRRKLALWHIGPSDAEAIMEHLEDRRFVDDRRYACAYARDKFALSGWGRRKIEAQLRMRRIDSAMIKEALACIEPEAYWESVCAFVRRRAATVSDLDTYEGRTRLFRAVVSRGFEPDVAAKALRQYLSEI